MPHKLLLRAGIFAVAVGLFLFWALPVWMRWAEIPYDQVSAVLFWFVVTLTGAGGFLLLRYFSGLLFPQLEYGQRFRMFPDIILRNVVPVAKYPAASLITQLPNFGLICGAALWILVFLFMIIEQPWPCYGLLIDLRTHELLWGARSPSEETLSVYLAAGDRFYVNGQPVAREALRTKLRQELSH